MWNTKSDTVRNDKFCLYLYFQEYVNCKEYIGDELLCEILEVAFSETVPEHTGN